MTSQDIKLKAIEWLFSQGASTVILVVILGYLGYSVHTQVPRHIEAIQQGYVLQEQRFLQALDRRDEQLTNALKGLSESHDKDRDLFLRLLENQGLVHGTDE